MGVALIVLVGLRDSQITTTTVATFWSWASSEGETSNGMHVSKMAGGASAAAGIGICILTLLRVRMALLEHRHGCIRERLISLRAAASRGQGVNGASVYDDAGSN